MLSLLSEVGYDQVYLIFHIRKYIVKEVTVVWVVNTYAMARHYLEEGNGNPLQYSCLENPLDRGAWGLQSMGSQRVRHDLAIEQTLSKEQISSVVVYTWSNWEFVAHFTSETYASFLTIFSLLIHSQNTVFKSCIQYRRFCNRFCHQICLDFFNWNFVGRVNVEE